MNLSENIKFYRKKAGITQEALAEYLDLTVGSISKWETGLTQPDIKRLKDLADIFEVSIDALVGYRPKFGIRDKYIEEIKESIKEKDYDKAVDLSNKLTFKYPNHFESLYQAGKSYFLRGLNGENKDEDLKKAIEIFQKSRRLIGENTEKKPDIVALDRTMANCYTELGEFEKAVSILKRSNFDGHNDLTIASTCAYSDDESLLPIAEKYLEASLMESILSPFISLIIIATLSHKEKPSQIERGLEATALAKDLISLLRLEGKISYLDRLLVLINYIESGFYLKKSEEDMAERSLYLAYKGALIFDADPDYSFKNIKIFKGGPESIIDDSFGPSAMEGLIRQIKEYDKEEGNDNMMTLLEKVKTYQTNDGEKGGLR